MMQWKIFKPGLIVLMNWSALAHEYIYNKTIMKMPIRFKSSNQIGFP